MSKKRKVAKTRTVEEMLDMMDTNREIREKYAERVLRKDIKFIEEYRDEYDFDAYDEDKVA